MELKDKGVLVTGGASGLGAACVRLLASEGAQVVIADRFRLVGLLVGSGDLPVADLKNRVEVFRP